MANKKTTVSVADAKREFSDLLGRVAYAHETILITRRGRPMAKLVPVEETHSETPPALAGRGWLDDDDPFFDIVEDVVSKRTSHAPRVTAGRPLPKRTGRSR